MTLTISKFRRLLPLLPMLAVTVFMVACAPLTVPPQSEYPVGRARLVLPPGEWQDLGISDETVSGDEGRITLQSRDVGLRGPQGEWLAVLRVQTNRTLALRGSSPDMGPCPTRRDILVEDGAAGSPVRTDCLRLKRWGNSAQWLENNRTDLAQWLGSRQIALVQPYVYLDYRYVTQAGFSVAVDALVDQRFLRPETRNAQEFLAAGRPALQWARDLAQAVRQSSGMMDGYLAIPAFPFSVPFSKT